MSENGTEAKVRLIIIKGFITFIYIIIIHHCFYALEYSGVMLKQGV